jgi:hypothetical protein
MRRGLSALCTLMILIAVTQWPGQASAEGARRPVPDYDGRGEAARVEENPLYGIPRALLLPLYFVSEYLVRRPLAFLVTTAEKQQWPKVLYDFFVFGEESNYGLVPSAYLDFGFLPSVGFYFFGNDVGKKGHDLRLHGATWGEDWISVTAKERFRLADGNRVSLRAEFTRRQDFIFAGLGPSSLETDRRRFGSNMLDLSVEFETNPARPTRIGTQLGVRTRAFHEGGCCEDPSLFAAVAQGIVPSPPGNGNTYQVAFAQVDGALDSRGTGREASRTGVRLQGFVRPSFDLRNAAPVSFVRFGASLGGAWEVNHKRTVSLTLGSQMVEPLGRRDAEIPFTELVSEGGAGAFEGFRPGRLLGRSSAYGSFRYSWPVWVFLDGSIHATVGNVFNEHFEGLRPGNARASAGIGVRTNGAPDNFFEFLLAGGTETFDQGGRPASFRLVFGTNRGM